MIEFTLETVANVKIQRIWKKKFRNNFENQNEQILLATLFKHLTHITKYKLSVLQIEIANCNPSNFHLYLWISRGTGAAQR